MASIRPQTRAMIESLVGFDTTSAKSNLALIDFAQQYLESLGVRCRRTLDPEAGKANLFASLGPEAPGGVVLSGHSDVVPVDAQPWDSDPFHFIAPAGTHSVRCTPRINSFPPPPPPPVPPFRAPP